MDREGGRKGMKGWVAVCKRHRDEVAGCRMRVRVGVATGEMRWKESNERRIERKRKRDGDATRRKIVVPSSSLVNNAN